MKRGNTLGTRWVVAYLSFLSRWLYPKLREQWGSNLKVRKVEEGGKTVALKSSSVPQSVRKRVLAMWGLVMGDERRDL